MASSLPQSFADAAQWPSGAPPLVRLPFPYHTSYAVVASRGQFQVVLHPTQVPGQPLPAPLHHDALHFSDLDVQVPPNVPDSSNTAWARARRAPSIALSWPPPSRPTVEHVWLLAYFVFTLRPDLEAVRLRLSGASAGDLQGDLHAVLLATPHPAPDPMQQLTDQRPFAGSDEVLLQRAAFWQGAGSPAGPKPIWLPSTKTRAGKPLANYPSIPQLPTLTTQLPPSDAPHEQRRVIHATHPTRPPKPLPGSVLYSRYFPSLGEEFSMVYLDVNDPEHLNLFHTWQNDPRVSAGWNETGDLDHHRRYLEAIDRDPHQFAVLAKFDDVYFAYFEFYYALEDHLGPHWNFDPYDRGRHTLVGNASLRGPHRANAWWASQVHFLFLDDPRTRNVVGEPKATNAHVIAYDLATGFSVEKFVDLPHKRSALVSLPRDRFFQLDPSGASVQQRVVAGTRLGLNAKL